MSEKILEVFKESQLVRKTPPKWGTIKEAAQILGVHYATIRRWAAQGLLDKDIAFKQGQKWKVNLTKVEYEGRILRSGAQPTR